MFEGIWIGAAMFSRALGDRHRPARTAGATPVKTLLPPWESGDGHSMFKTTRPATLPAKAAFMASA